MLKALENISAFYANPTRFMALAGQVHRPLWALAIGVLAYGLYRVAYVPADYQQGDSVRIMFVHVPAAWMSLFGYSFIFIASVTALIFRHPLGHVAARAAAPVGAVFTLLALITGSLWGQPMWGTWWVWDARLTSVLVLFFIYLGYIALWQAIDEPTRAARAASILAIVGFINVPIVKFSVDWWNTLHQPASVSRLARPALHADFLYPLLIMGAGFLVLFLALTLTRMQMEVLRQRLRARAPKGEPPHV
ncbi:heme ABC transporter permease [Alphaproteobacteria bacterium]|jgi:heme exporter protein C|nr:heme ABC transporter permease [Alphaproteobacteria bacterium]